MHDTQTALTLFRLCAQPSLDHLLAADVLCHCSSTSTPSLFNWHSSFSSTITTANHAFLAALTQQPLPLPPISVALAFHPASLGGLGLRGPAGYALISYLIPLIRSIRYATSGIPLPDAGPIPIPPVYTRAFMSWSSPEWGLSQHLEEGCRRWRSGWSV